MRVGSKGPNPRRSAVYARLRRATAAAPRAAGMLAIGSALAAFCFFTWRLLTVDPAPWPDEALFANPAVNLLRRGRLATDLMAGLLPGIEERTYWMPPFYLLVLAATFRAFGIGLLQMRLVTAATAGAVLGLVAALGRRIGVRPLTAGVGMAAVAIDFLFLRGARIGRMDMLALALGLLALYLALPASDRGPVWRWRPVVAGLVAGLALLSHPMGGVLAAGASAALLIAPAAPRRRALPLFVLGAMIALLPWAVYALQDAGSFSTQMAAQLHRKAAWHPWQQFGKTAVSNFKQYGGAGDEAQVAWLLGAIGLALQSLRSPGARAVLLTQVLLLVATTAAVEMWYPIYVLPLTGVGLGCLVDMAARQKGVRRLAVFPLLAVLAWVALGNLREEARLLRRWNSAVVEASRYDRFCERISASLPQGARVLTAIIPDPYLGLAASRPDLVWRQAPPYALPVKPAAADRIAADADYILIGPWVHSNGPVGRARRRGVSVAVVKQGKWRADVHRMRPDGARASRPAPDRDQMPP